jgi:hypothetical protein
MSALGALAKASASNEAEPHQQGSGSEALPNVAQIQQDVTETERGLEEVQRKREEQRSFDKTMLDAEELLQHRQRQQGKPVEELEDMQRVSAIVHDLEESDRGVQMSRFECTRLEHVIEEAPPKVQKATDEVLRPVRTVEVTRLTHREQPPSAHSPHSPEDPKPLVPSQPVDMTPHCSDPHCSDSDDPNVHLRQLLLKALDHEHDQAKRERAQIKHERQRHKQLVRDIKQQTRDIRQETRDIKRQTRIKEEQLMEDKSKIARLEQELRRCLEEEAIRESEHHAEEQKLDQTTSVSGS